ncbi:hypothetical protein [Reinekea sp. G2M2-21]|uniref:hypothetical protein n=1 Tax=Reinekea sp. G2M2-21 TaxID=2788942 RepID=UPI0018AC75B7|nr:hypothetical protein [Reinekea sp. G2M2-21]
MITISRIENFDVDGNTLTDIERIDRDGDGYWDELLEFEQEYDAQGNMTRDVQTDANHHMFEPDSKHVYDVTQIFNEIGLVASKCTTSDYSADGIIDNQSTETITYDEALNQIRHYREYDGNNDGTINFVRDIRTSYNSTGLKTSELERIDTNNDGEYDSIVNKI